MIPVEKDNQTNVKQNNKQANESLTSSKLSHNLQNVNHKFKLSSSKVYEWQIKKK